MVEICALWLAIHGGFVTGALRKLIPLVDTHDLSLVRPRFGESKTCRQQNHHTVKVTQRRAYVTNPAELPSKELQVQTLLLGKYNPLLIPSELDCARCKMDGEVPYIREKAFKCRSDL